MILTLRMLYGQTEPVMDNFRTKAQWKKYEKQYGNPDMFLGMVEISISGNNYKQKQESLREQARNIQLLLSQSTQSYRTLVEVQNWLMTKATTYGLVKEFRENGII